MILIRWSRRHGTWAGMCHPCLNRWQRGVITDHATWDDARDWAITHAYAEHGVTL